MTGRGRFAPSPSGRMHLGNVFAALLAWLSARSQNGEFILRIEDLDPQRSKMEYIYAIREDLCWLGLDWDAEMPLQSEQNGVYSHYFNFLREQNLVYPCFCTRNELHDASAPHGTDGQLLYSGRCRNLTEEERRNMTRKGAWRVCVPADEVTFTDGVYGEVSERLDSACGDFIIRRSDGVFAYQLAVVCDDALGGITEVVRGVDLLSSTPRQIWLYKTLGFTPPNFCHVPLLVAPDGRRLSKREKDLDLGHLRQTMSAEKLIGKLAYLAGLTEKPEAIAAKELIGAFAWGKISRENIPISDNFC